MEGTDVGDLLWSYFSLMVAVQAFKTHLIRWAQALGALGAGKSKMQKTFFFFQEKLKAFKLTGANIQVTQLYKTHAIWYCIAKY